MKLIERLIEKGGSDSGSRNFVGPKISENVVRLIRRHFPSYVESDSSKKKKKEHRENVCKEVAEASMQSAALEEVTLTNSSDIIISGDGTWKTRGYSSRVGVCAVIGDKTGKCIDAEVMSSFCKGCDSWKRRKGSPAYKKWKILHVKECLKNHNGSAGMMETVGMWFVYFSVH
ncbi:uncharacterized protein TNCV_1997691 [Trichonephila clavipes]|uniref:Mutator-like transposase domain-containing protein n=1 Tax=Trichonephila clavipes TaxID=2585209 RepID=A0A8X6V6S5_TRICX|nr:uncharacterized protein TNCV_1997691 [Trichonephila clavipes]